MKIFAIYVIITCLLIISIIGCKKKGGVVPDPIVPDTTKPTIAITKPTAGQLFVPGSIIAFQAIFNDNVMLKSYQIVISKVVTGGLTLKIVPVSIPFSYTKPSTNFNADAKQQEVILSDITIPINTSTTVVTTGKYNFKVTCIDISNNISETTLEINIY